LMRTHDWLSEWRLLEERAARGLETCPPGIGFTAGPGRILHICPGEDGRALVHYHFSERQRWLGLIPHDAAVVRTKYAVESSQLAEVVRHFFDDDHGLQQTFATDRGRCDDEPPGGNAAR
jgi:hypothetical protein